MASSPTVTQKLVAATSASDNAADTTPNAALQHPEERHTFPDTRPSSADLQETDTFCTKFASGACVSGMTCQYRHVLNPCDDFGFDGTCPDSSCSKLHVEYPQCHSRSCSHKAKFKRFCATCREAFRVSRNAAPKEQLVMAVHVVAPAMRSNSDSHEWRHDQRGDGSRVQSPHMSRLHSPQQSPHMSRLHSPQQSRNGSPRHNISSTSSRPSSRQRSQERTPFLSPLRPRRASASELSTTTTTATTTKSTCVTPTLAPIRSRPASPYVAVLSVLLHAASSTAVSPTHPPASAPAMLPVVATTQTLA